MHMKYIRDTTFLNKFNTTNSKKNANSTTLLIYDQHYTKPQNK